MLRFITRMKEVREDESGITVAEILVAFTIILISVLGSALAMGGAFSSQSTSEARNRAVQIARGYIEESRLVSFSDLGFTSDYNGMSQIEGGLDGRTSYNGETIVVFPAGTTSNITFKPYQEVAVGKYSLQASVYITKVRTNTFDGAVSPVTAAEIAPKRVSVVVQWDTEDGTQEVIQSWVRYPQSVECVPVAAMKDTSSLAYAPIGCRP